MARAHARRLMTVLDDILSATRDEVERLRREPIEEVGHAPRDVAKLLRRDGPLHLIAEIKKRSPSAGALSTRLSVRERARTYASCGATMISVLVDRAHFAGGYEDLSEARRATDVPLLAKGFALDDVQLDGARRAGADAVLLIVRILDDATLRTLVAGSHARGLTPIVEVVDEDELDRALAAGAEVIGVNARDLSTLIIDRERAARVAASIPPKHVRLWFSGVSTPDEVRRLARTDVDGALIGESLMRQDDPGELLRAMVAATR
jgi:indole-3-glycerol phosphate synthase